MQQWVDLARLTGLQSTEDEGPPPSPALEGQEANLAEDSLEPQTSTWEQPPLTLENLTLDNLTLENLTLDNLTLENTDVVPKHEAEPTRVP
jgi:hypothetical protein